MKLIVYDSWAQSWARLLFLKSRILHSPPWMEQKFLFRVWYVNFFCISKEAKTKTYSFICNDFQYFVRSIKKVISYFMIFIVSVREPKWGRTVPFVMTFNILWDPLKVISYFTIFIVSVRKIDQLPFWSVDCLFQRPIFLETCCCFEIKFFYFLDILFICSMVDMNMSLPKINCPGDFVIL
jgi:hypothetical protein